MAVNDSYGLFWDSEGGDRKYNAESFETWLKKFFTTGVFTGDLAVSATEGMVVSVSNGYTNVNGKVRFFDSATTFTIAAAGSSNPRIDTVVVERNDSDREITMKVVQGSYAATPSATAPVRTGGVYQLVLAEIYVGTGVSSITQSNITDKRTDSDVCGIVTGTVEEVDITQIVAQMEDDFETWFDHMKDQLDTDAAGHLQAEIDAINNNIAFTTIAPPSASGSYYYDGTEKTVSWSNVDTTKVEIQGIASATDAGTYECRATLKRPYTKWTNGDVNPISVQWTINKRQNYLLLSSYTYGGELLTDTKTHKICDITRKSTGNVSATSTVGSVSIVNDEVFLTVSNYNTVYNGTVTVSDSGDENNAVSTKAVAIEGLKLIPPTVYGFHLDGTVSDPAQMISYDVQYDGAYVKNRDYTPAHVDLSTGVMYPGSWNLTDDFFVPKSCMLKYDGTRDYYLNEYDETKKTDGTASDVADASYDGNAMMEWGRDGQKIYMKIVPDSTPTNGATYYFSNKKLDDGFTCWPFYDCDGNEIDHFYTPKYIGSDISSKLRSISGQAQANNQLPPNITTKATANNVNNKTEWYIDVFADRQLINALLLLIGKNCNAQAVFGEGYTTEVQGDESFLPTTGSLNGKGQWFGLSINNDKAKGVKIFGMEHWWGSQERITAGLTNNMGTIKYKLTYSQEDGTTGTGYNFAGTGYKTLANSTIGGTNRGYISAMIFSEDGMFAKTASGSSTTYFCDGIYFNNTRNTFFAVGGAVSHDALCGPLAWYLFDEPSATDVHFTAALSCKPLAQSA